MEIRTLNTGIRIQIDKAVARQSQKNDFGSILGRGLSTSPDGSLRNQALLQTLQDLHDVMGQIRQHYSLHQDGSTAPLLVGIANLQATLRGMVTHAQRTSGGGATGGGGVGPF